MNLKFNKVTRTIKYNNKQLYDVGVMVNTQIEQFKVTANHPFYVKEKGFTRVDKLVLSDQLITANQAKLNIQKVIKTDTFAEVHDLTVDSSHTYFVGRKGLWVHNSGGAHSADNAFEADRKKYLALNNQYFEQSDSLSESGQQQLEGAMNSLRQRYSPAAERLKEKLGEGINWNRVIDDQSSFADFMHNNTPFATYKQNVLADFDSMIQAKYPSQQKPMKYLSFNLGMISDTNDQKAYFDSFRSYFESLDSWSDYYSKLPSYDVHAQ